MFGLDWKEFVLNPLTPLTGVPSKYTNPLNAVPGLNWDSVTDNINLDPKDIVSGITDTAGLTDTGAAQRGLEALQSGAEAATTALDADMAPVFEMYKKAKVGRNMKNVLDTYRTGMMGTENAAGAKNVQQFLNPMYDRAIENATNQALAGAGSSLQSSAANQAVGTAVGNQVQNMWNNAFQQAMADAQNKQGIYGRVAQSDLMPSLNWAQLASDVAGTKYTTGMDLAQATGQVAGQNQSITANMF
jgi:hypothetical protein